ncbi:MAG: sulfurtransferase TusA family protein [Candidatus Hadarchaeia archaeon]
MSGEKTIEVMGETCPVPLVETRKAIRNMKDGEVIEVVGNHAPSKKEIPMAVEEMGLELLEVKEEGERWKIRIKKSEQEEK